MAQVYKNVVQDICYLKILQSCNNKNRTSSAFFSDQIDCYKSLCRFLDNLLQDLQQKCNAIDDNKRIKLPLIHGDSVWGRGFEIDTTKKMQRTQEIMKQQVCMRRNVWSWHIKKDASNVRCREHQGEERRCVKMAKQWWQRFSCQW
jgi:hypothetical protein